MFCIAEPTIKSLVKCAKPTGKRKNKPIPRIKAATTLKIISPSLRISSSVSADSLAE